MTQPLDPLEMTEPAARPFTKFVGGKTQLLPELLSRAPKFFGRYFEPFVGGGAMLFALAAARSSDDPLRAFINDSNPWLMQVYEAIRQNVDGVIRLLYDYERQYRLHGEKFYYEVRKLGPTGEITEGGARLIFLLKTNYNGLWRVNRAGQYNVPHGKRKGLVTICDEDNLVRVSKVLQHTTCHWGDFQTSVDGNAVPGDFVYFDPPYVPVSATADFTSYTKEAFGPGDQIRLRDCALSLKRRGVHVMLSNADVPFVHELYGPGDFTIERVKARRNINSKADKRGKVGEVIIT